MVANVHWVAVMSTAMHTVPMTAWCAMRVMAWLHVVACVTVACGGMCEVCAVACAWHQ